MKPSDVAQWMKDELQKYGCIYQDDVVDYLVKSKSEALLCENSEENLVVGSEVLGALKKLMKNRGLVKA